MPLIEIFLFGSPQVLYDGNQIDFVRRKAIALIAYLAVTNQRHSRDTLAEFLWPDNDGVRSRASLRRVLFTISETPLTRWVDADRDTIALLPDDNLWIDVRQFNQLLSQPDHSDSLLKATTLYRDHFMAGFTLRDSAAFDHWQSSLTQNLQQKLLNTFERLVTHYLQQQQLNEAASILRQWLHFDPFIETAQYRLIEVYARTGQRAAALAQYETYAALLQMELGVLPQAETRDLYERITQEQPIILDRSVPSVRGNLPPLPTLVVGREQAVADIRQRLKRGDSQNPSLPAQIIIQGWPGIGKTTLSAVIAHDKQIQNDYQDGVLWTSLGQKPNLLPTLIQWGQSLGFHELDKVQTVEDASARLTAFLKDKRVLIIIDDVWSVEHAQPLKIGSTHSGLLMTTRLNDVARAFADRPELLYKIPILSIDESLTLLRTLAPQVVDQYPDGARELVTDLEGLPLALQVAGRLLHAEIEFGWGIGDLLSELREGRRLLEAQAPADRMELATETTPTIAALLQRSVERLSPDVQEKFALLGVFAPKPATFTLEAMQAVWHVEDAKPAARTLIARGLLEPSSNARFQMHALLVMHAQSMFQG